MTVTQEVRQQVNERLGRRARSLYRRLKSWKSVAELLGFKTPSAAWKAANRSPFPDRKNTEKLNPL